MKTEPRIITIRDGAVPLPEELRGRPGFADGNEVAMWIHPDSLELYPHVREALTQERRIVATGTLLDCGFTADVEGFACLREALVVLLEDGRTTIDALHRTVAQRVGGSPVAVERAMRYAIGRLYVRGTLEGLQRYCGPMRGTAATRSVLYALADAIRLHFPTLAPRASGYREAE